MLNFIYLFINYLINLNQNIKFKMKKVEELITSKDPSINNNNTSSDNKKDFSYLISELTKIKNEGNSLYKQKKLEEAKKTYENGLEKLKEELSLIHKEIGKNEQCKHALILYKKILSNIALCYYKQENYEKSIEYDLKIIQEDPKFGKSIVRLFISYSKINKITQAIFYGDLFLELDQATRDKFKDFEKKIQDEKQKIIQKKEKANIKKQFVKYGVPMLVLLLAILIFLVFRKK